MTNKKNDNAEETGFAPHNITDGRDIGSWGTRYTSAQAIRGIRIELTFLVILFIGCPIFVFVTWAGYLQTFLSLDIKHYTYLKPYIYGSFGGLLAGTIFSLKWLYHSVAKGIWNVDRRLWRTITPLLSCGLAFTSIVFFHAGLFSTNGSNAIHSGSVAFSIGFIVGYFSDSFVAKLTEISQIIFGTMSKR